ncbi:proteinase T-like protein [Lojkania enalia]|uniref:Proteinase T-like protein n=1 Tax=Lojkania enalia TaxID=147567 RepID=A0A9P4KHY5_9PLEO|nr:proteinase T-like protein [Didymosphaeria enalia]
MRLIVVALASLYSTVRAVAPFVGLNSENAISGSYIVVLKKGISNAALDSHLSWADGVVKRNSNVRKSSFSIGGFKGYHLQASKEIATALAESEEIDYIEVDQTFTTEAYVDSESEKLFDRDVQANAPWNLARISHRQRGSTDYVFTPTTGVYAYIMDTGVRVTHQAFQGRASWGYNVVDTMNDDTNGHGTFVAGIVSSQTYGVARFANIIAVKILNASGSGTYSGVIQGINWAVQDMTSKGRVGKSTALLAIGGSYSTAMNQAVASASNSGLFFAVPAGNSNSNAANFSPASEPTACTTAATSINDAVMSGSNYGSVIDIFAPGQSVTGPWISSPTSTAVLSGGSVASAHIAGLGAYFLAIEGPRSPVALCARLQEVATPNVLTGVPAGTVNLLAYNNSGL